MKNKLIMSILLILSISNVQAAYPILEEEKCVQVMEEEIEFDKENKYHTECMATAVAEDVNIMGPTKVDSMTTLVNVTALKDVIIYNYRVTLPKRMLPNIDSIKKVLKKTITMANCQNKEIKSYILDININIVHTYYLKKGDLLTSFKISAADCENVKL